MSKEKIKIVINKISDYRTASGAVVDQQFKLITQIVTAVEEIKARGGDEKNYTERDLGVLQFYTQIAPIIKESLGKISEYNDALKDDYIGALNALSEIKAGDNNAS